MPIIDHASEPVAQWRPGVMTRMLVSALNGSTTLCLFEQFCDPGTGAPTHTHSVEEILTVVAGSAEIWCDEARARLGAGQSMVVQAGVRHGFTNFGQTTLHVRATLAAPIFEAWFEGQADPTRRWAQGTIA